MPGAARHPPDLAAATLDRYHAFATQLGATITITTDSETESDDSDPED